MTKFGIVFAALFVVAAAFAPLDPLRAYRRTEREPAVARNERLTALSGAAIYVLLIAVAVTVLQIRPLLGAHYFVGFSLIPPVALKLWTTGSRFVHHYGGSIAYRLAGPPPLLLRFVVAPLLVVSTIAVFATGLELWTFGLAFGDGWVSAHTLSAVGLILSGGAAHVIGHARRSVAAVVEEVAARPSRAAVTRRSIVIGTLLLGLAIALASLLYATPFPPAAVGN